MRCCCCRNNTHTAVYKCGVVRGMKKAQSAALESIWDMIHAKMVVGIFLLHGVKNRSICFDGLKFHLVFLRLF